MNAAEGYEGGQTFLTYQHHAFYPQLVHTNWLLNHLAQQMIETLGHVPFCAHWVHAGSLLGDKLGELSGLQTPSNSQELFPFHGQQEQSLPDVGYSARVDRDL